MTTKQQILKYRKHFEYGFLDSGEITLILERDGIYTNQNYVLKVFRNMNIKKKPLSVRVEFLCKLMAGD